MTLPSPNSLVAEPPDPFARETIRNAVNVSFRNCPARSDSLVFEDYKKVGPAICRVEVAIEPLSKICAGYHLATSEKLASVAKDSVLLVGQIRELETVPKTGTMPHNCPHSQRRPACWK